MWQTGRLLLVWVAVFSLGWSDGALAQSGVKVELEEVVDDRFSEGPLSGALQITMVLTGKDLERAEAARVIVREARDDRGTDLVRDPDVPDFQSREYNNGKLDVRLQNPARQATSIQLKGTVELFVPSRDANARIRVEKALSTFDAPLKSKGLRAAKISITPLSPQKYRERMNAQKLDDAKIAEIRARGKAEGASNEEILQAIELIKALQELGGGEISENAVVLAGPSKDFDRIHSVDILGADGKPISIGSRSTSSDGENATMILEPSEPVPSNAAIQFTLLTDKAKMSVPFDVKNVMLP